MEIDLAKAKERYMTLSEEDKDDIRDFMKSEAREIIAKVFGAEFDKALGSFKQRQTPKRRGLASR